MRPASAGGSEDSVIAGTKIGGQKAAAKNLAKNPNFYAEIGAKGGANGRTGGFAAYVDCFCKRFSGRHDKAQCAGAVGGTISRRKKAVTNA
jgi:general stress protein YciG